MQQVLPEMAIGYCWQVFFSVVYFILVIVLKYSRPIFAIICILFQLRMLILVIVLVLVDKNISLVF